MRDDDRNTPGGWVWFWWALLAALAVNWFVSSAALAPAERAEVSYTFFVEQVDAGKERFTTQRPSWADDGLSDTLTRHDVVINAEPPDTGPSLFWQLLVGFGPTLLLFAVIAWGMRRAAGGMAGGLGRSRARLYEPDEGNRVTFADVAGIDEVESEVREVVDFLRDPDRDRRLGAQIPRGVLLSGPPGTGKTLLARAVAGEANVPFLSISASEFIEMVVGVGAARVRDLFEQAKKSAPAIIFIDELDAIGRARGGAHAIGGHDEREQTLILDPALLRPGRFDRRVPVNPPDMRGRRHHDRVTAHDFSEALEKVLLGTARGITLSPEERERTAYHESGHALLGMLTPGADPVRKVSIIPCGHALGVTFQRPETDRYGYSATDLRGRIVGAPEGRAAEDVVDTEVRRLVDECYRQAVDTLRSHGSNLDALVHTLLERETLDEQEAYQAAGISREQAPGGIARGETAGTSRAPGLPPEHATVR